MYGSTDDCWILITVNPCYGQDWNPKLQAPAPTSMTRMSLNHAWTQQQWFKNLLTSKCLLFLYLHSFSPTFGQKCHHTWSMCRSSRFSSWSLSYWTLISRPMNWVTDGREEETRNFYTTTPTKACQTESAYFRITEYTITKFLDSKMNLYSQWPPSKLI